MAWTANLTTRVLKLVLRLLPGPVTLYIWNANFLQNISNILVTPEIFLLLIFLINRAFDLFLFTFTLFCTHAENNLAS